MCNLRGFFYVGKNSNGIGEVCKFNVKFSRRLFTKQPHLFNNVEVI